MGESLKLRLALGTVICLIIGGVCCDFGGILGLMVDLLIMGPFLLEILDQIIDIDAVLNFFLGYKRVTSAH